MDVLRPTLRVTPLPGGADVPRLLRALADRPGLAVLDSAGGAPCRFSLVAFDPLPLAPPTTLAGLREFVARLAPRGVEAVPGPFAGGFIGALAYDLGVAGEALALPPPAWPNPPLVGGLYTDFVVVRHAANGDAAEAWAVFAEGGEARRAALERALAAEGEGAVPLAPVRALGPLVRHVPAAEHVRRVRDIQARIGRGEVYQVNLAHRYERAVAGDPLALYLRLRALSPAPYMGYLAWDAAPGGALLSASPELLLEVDVEAHAGDERALVARTRPIKGTAPRSRDAREDAAHRAALLASAKDRAELAMIVDLERNDLARVATPGSVRVEGFPTLETYRNVHHLVADVRATLRPGLDAVDALGALFPGGSITGAPKLASMEVIAALEGEGRGFFTGALGCLDALGRARFNVLIRTLVFRPDAPSSPPAAPAAPAARRGAVSFHVGGGITWRSDPEAEEHETRMKGAALAAALAGVDQPVDTLGAVLAQPEDEGASDGHK